MATRSAIAKSLIWSGLSNYSGFAIGIVVRLYLARSLSPEDFGIYAVVTASCDVLQVFAAAKLNLLLVQHRDVEGADHATGVMTRWQAAVSLGLGAALVAAAAIRSGPLLAGLLAAYLSAQVLGYFRAYQQTLLERDLHYRPVATATLWANVTAGGLTIAGASVLPGAWVLAAKDLLAALAALLFLGRQAVSHGVAARANGSAPRSTYVRLARTSAQFFAQTHGDHLADRVDVVALGMSSIALSSVGQYSQAKWLVLTGVNVLSMSLSPMLTVYSRLWHENVSNTGTFAWVNFLAVRGSTVIAGVLILWPGEVVRLVLGSSWGEAAGWLALLAPAIVGQVAFTHINSAAIAEGAVKQAAWLAWGRVALFGGIAFTWMAERPAWLAATYGAGIWAAALGTGALSPGGVRRVTRDLAPAAAYLAAAALIASGTHTVVAAGAGAAVAAADAWRLWKLERERRST